MPKLNDNEILPLCRALGSLKGEMRRGFGALLVKSIRQGKLTVSKSDGLALYKSLDGLEQKAQRLRNLVSNVSKKLEPCGWKIVLDGQTNAELQKVETSATPHGRETRKKKTSVTERKTSCVIWQYTSSSSVRFQEQCKKMVFRPRLTTASAPREVDDVVLQKSTNLEWETPSTIEDYDSHVSAQLEEKRKAYPHLKDSWCWHVRDFDSVEGDTGVVTGSRVILEVVPLQYRHEVATTLSRAVSLIQGGAKFPVLELLKKFQELDETLASKEWLHSANLLSVDVSLITCDGYLMMRQNADRRWEPAINGHVDVLLDVVRSDPHQPEPRETVFRKGCELLGVPMRPARVAWLGVGVGVAFGNVSLFGELKTNLTHLQVIEAHSKFVLKENQKDSFKLKAISLAVAEEAMHEVTALEAEQNPPTHTGSRNHAQLLHALTLRRYYRGKVNLKCGVYEDWERALNDGKKQR